MKVIGLNHGEIDSSAALIIDGQVKAATSEERFNRQKKTKVFPRQALDFCLASNGLDLSEADAIAQGWNPGAGWQKYNPMISGLRVRREDNFYSIPDHLFNVLPRKAPDWVAVELAPESKMPKIYHVLHHRAHAANAFFTSDFEESAILTCDWRGEFECSSWGVGRGNKIDTYQTQVMPHSLGMVYATFTEILGYRPDNDEWKVMALSAFDIDANDLVEKLLPTFKLNDDGTFELDTKFYKGAELDTPHLYTPALLELLGGRLGKANEEPSEWHLRVAKAMQIIAEKIATHMLVALHARTKVPNLVVGGGFFMNSVFNGKILDRTPFKRLFVSHAPGDIGNSIGAALYLAHCVLGEERSYSPSSSYLGPSFTNEQIEASLRRRKVRYRRMNDAPAEIAATLAEGKICARFDGRMEFGERALGNRSILADPRKDTIKDEINAMIKYREAYRPFAPSVLQERCQDFFDVPAGFDCPFMEKVVPVRANHRAGLPAITHVDGSGRVQTVKKEANPQYYRIIEEFGKLTGVPIVLNTSFNVNGEPIVLSPDDALTTFFNSGLENLAIGDFMVQK